MDPGAAARRSRRGYWYQDLYAAMCCMDMLAGKWETVTSDGLEDVTCVAAKGRSVRHSQVKTIDDVTYRWSLADATRAERLGDPASSVLGRLFSGKPLRTSRIHFELVANRPPDASLATFAAGSSAVDAKLITSASSRLVGLTLHHGRKPIWCLERFQFVLAPHTADGLEDTLVRRLANHASMIGYPLIPEEADVLFQTLMSAVRAAAQGTSPTPIDRVGLSALVEAECRRISISTDESLTASSTTLAAKLGAIGLNPSEVLGHQGARILFSRTRRSAIGPRRRLLDRLSDEIYARVAELRASWIAGQMDSVTLYQRSMTAALDVARMPQFAVEGIGAADGFGCLQDITARCRHRYD